MSKELIDRLRDNRVTGFNLTVAAVEAADTIERLERELADSNAQHERDVATLEHWNVAITELQRELETERALSFRNQVADLYSKGHRLAFALECVLLATDSDLAAVSKYWDEAHAALEDWRA